tara:strand:- start:340 stop:558 length:219 start_codon:yes stop_codon:yes gene_type:complete
MNEVENLFKKINEIKSHFHFSMDIYYNDLDNTFVVKLLLIKYDFEKSGTKHFRNFKLIDSMLDAYIFLKSEI